MSPILIIIFTIAMAIIIGLFGHLIYQMMKSKNNPENKG